MWNLIVLDPDHCISCQISGQCPPRTLIGRRIHIFDDLFPLHCNLLYSQATICDLFEMIKTLAET